MARTLDVVLVHFPNKTKPYAFEAPKYSRLGVGDVVTVEQEDGTDKEAIVINKHTYDLDYEMDDFNFLIDAVGAKKPLKKVVAHIVRNEFEYEEENEDE